MRTVNQKFEVIVFTASEAVYADPILDHIDPTGELISHRFYRQQCVEVQKNLFVKDLRVLGQRPLDKTMLVDNSLHSFMLNLRNGMPILPFINDKEDDQLPVLAEFLMGMNPSDDVRSVLDTHFCYNEFISSADTAAFMHQLKGYHSQVLKSPERGSRTERSLSVKRKNTQK